jgi:hypothetical protein
MHLYLDGIHAVHYLEFFTEQQPRLSAIYCKANFSCVQILENETPRLQLFRRVELTISLKRYLVLPIKIRTDDRRIMDNLFCPFNESAYQNRIARKSPRRGEDQQHGGKKNTPGFMLNDSHSFESVEIRNYQLKRLTSNCKKTKKTDFAKLFL